MGTWETTEPDQVTGANRTKQKTKVIIVNEEVIDSGSLRRPIRLQVQPVTTKMYIAVLQLSKKLPTTARHAAT